MLSTRASLATRVSTSWASSSRSETRSGIILGFETLIGPTSSRVHSVTCGTPRLPHPLRLFGPPLRRNRGHASDRQLTASRGTAPSPQLERNGRRLYAAEH